VEIRAGRAGDAEAIARIYAVQVLHGTAPFEEVPPTADEMRGRIEALIARDMPVLVAERAGRVVGYALAGTYRPRAAYRYTVENSVYVEEAEKGRGIGRALLGRLIGECRACGFRQIVAVIGDSANEASIGLHRALGFRHVGILRNVGVKFGRELDTVLMQLDLTADQ
jgi:phosphinothricin acetyltransferase